MIDCHAHLGSVEFDMDRDAVIERATRAGVERVLVVGEDIEDDRKVLGLCRSHPEALRPCVGLHPDRFAEDRPLPDRGAVEAVARLAREHRAELAAIGEVGLDYWYVKSDERRALSRDALAAMSELGLELDLPLNVHSRSAGHHTLDLLAECGATRVLMHAFDGKAGHALRAFERHGWLFSIPPSVVRSAQKQKLVRVLPLDALALESDSPVLGPEPKQRNEPANLTVAVELIAQLKGVSPERVREVTRASTLRLFGAT